MRLGLRHSSLRTRFILASVTMIVLITVLMSLAVFNRFRKVLDAETAKRGETLAGQLGTMAQLPLRTGGRERLKELAEEALLLEDMEAIEFLDAEDRSLVKMERPAPSAARSVEYTYPILRQQRAFRDEMDLLDGTGDPSASGRLGAIRMRLSLAATDRIIERIYLTIVAAAVILAMIFILVSAQLARRITEPIGRLIEGIETIRKGRLDVAITEIDDGEIGVLAHHFNQMSRELKDSVDRMIQQEKMASLGRMASCISHELGSPLNSVMFDAELIREEVGEGPAGESAKRIADQTRRMRDTIRNLLDYARTPSGQLSEVDLAQALDEARQVLAAPIRKSGLQVVSALPPDLPQVYAVKNLIVQVFVNLINNAIDATGQGGQLLIEAAIPEGPARIQIVFSDNGPGIPADRLEKIFEPFYTTKPEGEGAGLGLSICQYIMQGFGGEIVAASTKPRGASFTLTFQKVK